MNQINWGEVFIFVVMIAVHAGVVWNSISNHRSRLEKLEESHGEMKDNHQKIELTVVNVPTKDDMTRLSNEIQQLKITLAKLETILSLMAHQQGIPTAGKPHIET